MTTPSLGRLVLRRIACAVVRAEVQRLREAPSPALTGPDWPDELPIGEEGLALDSLEQLGALGALAEIFLLDDSALPASAPLRVGDWIDWAERGRQGSEDAVAVKTSGSTGEPKTCVHDLADLVDEAEHLATQFSACHRVVALVPASHLYGMIWTAFLPEALGVPVVDRTLGSPLGLEAGDLVVAVPAQWDAMLRMNLVAPAGCVAVSSAGQLPDSLAEKLLRAGFRRVVDVYGSSETGAIAMRDAPSAGYQLLPRWELMADGDDWQIVDRKGETLPLPDHVERLSPRLIRPLGRRDGGLKIGGHTVWPEQVASVLRETKGVADIAVRLGANGRLKAFVVANEAVDPATLQVELHRLAGVRLTVAERPVTYSFGTALPRNDMGKLADWP